MGGTPQALSPSTAGYIASASGDGSTYTFPPAIQLEPNTQYFFYADLGLSSGSLTQISSQSGGTFTGGDSYGAANGNGNFALRPFDIAFSLEGTALVPEPAGYLLSLIGPMAIGLRRRRKR